MDMLILGLVLFLGVHSVRIAADGWRGRMLARLGEKTWKGLYSVISLLGFALLCWGYGLARQEPTVLWVAPAGLRHATALFTLIAFVLVAAAYVPRNSIRARLHHPMLLGTKTWALGHLLSNGNLADVLLFGGFLIWAVLCFASARRRDRIAGTSYPSGTIGATLLTVGLGVALTAVFAMWLHTSLIGVRPY